MRKLVCCLSMLCVLLVLAACSEKSKSSPPARVSGESASAPSSGAGASTRAFALKGPISKYPKQETITRLDRVFESIKKLNALNHKTVATQLYNVGDAKMSYQEKWALLVKSNAEQLEVDPDKVEQTLCFDGWGNRFNIDAKPNLDSKVMAKRLKNSIFIILVWSSGPNGRNEYGKGDDVVGNMPVPKGPDAPVPSEEPLKDS